MKICGRDGTELRCCKNGLVIHDERYRLNSRHAADVYFCPTCHAILIKRNDHEYTAGGPVHCIITDKGLRWNEAFMIKIRTQYGVYL